MEQSYRAKRAIGEEAKGSQPGKGSVRVTDNSDQMQDACRSIDGKQAKPVEVTGQGGDNIEKRVDQPEQGGKVLLDNPGDSAKHSLPGGRLERFAQHGSEVIKSMGGLVRDAASLADT